MFIIPKLNSKCIFKYPFDGGKRLSLAECSERNKIALFLFVYISVSPTKGSRFIKKNKLKARKQNLKQHKTARRYRSAYVNDLELKTCEDNINIL